MKNRLLAKSLAGLTAGAMLAGSMPVTAFAVTGEQVAADGTYTAEAAVVNDEAITEGDEWENYNVTVTVTVADGLIASIGTTDATEGSASYLAKAVSKKKGINTLLAGQPATAAAVEGWEAVSGATIASNAMKAAVLEALAGAPEAAAEPQKVCAYVLMNIPYDKFYEAEGVSGVEAVTSATVKTFNQNMAAGSYHDCYTTEDASNAEILGVTYPVYVEDVTLLEGFTEVTDDSAATITVAAGKSSLTTKGVTGRDVLFASPSYSYYVLADEPSAYKVMTASDGAVSFGAVQAAAVSGEADAELTYGGHYTDITLSVDAPEVTDTAKVNAVTMTMDDGSEYALRHVLHVWRKTELGWNYADWDLGGRTIKSLTYYLEDNGAFSVVTYPLDIAVKLAPKEVGASFAGNASMSVTGLPENIENPAATVKSKVGRGQTPVVLAENVPVTDGTIALDASPEIGTTYTVTVTSDNYADMKAEAEYNLYVLMNIPYEKFYENEISDGDHAVDTVSSATGAKTQMYNMFPGTFRGETGKIEGVTYPVKVPADVDLSAYTKVTDEDTARAEWSAHGQPAGQDLTGSECLFMKGAYAWYALAAEPAAYKELTVGADGSFTFGTSTAAVNAADGVTASIASSSGYGDYQLTIDGLDYQRILGIVANTAERSYAFRHLENIWRGGMQVAWTTGFTTSEHHGNDLSYMADYYKDIMGQTITSLTVYGVDADGNYVTDNYDIEDLYVAKKTAAKVTAEDIMDTDTALPVAVTDDAEGVYTVYTVDDAAVTVADGKADVSALGLTPGSHTVKVVDAAGEYAPISSSFTVTTATMPAAYDEASVSLVAAEGATAEEFAAYLKNITKVSVNGNNYNASGRGAVKVIGDDGAIDQEKLSYGANDLVVTSTGYPELAFEAMKLFPDVQDSGKWYYNSVYWAAGKGVTSGYGDGNFRPEEKLTRAQTVAFLYKMAGSPAVEETEISFSDVKDTDWFAGAVKWAVANKITSGYGEGTFSPNAHCTRAMIVTFISNYAENIEGLDTTAKAKADFSDVKDGDWFRNAVDWAVENKITSGYGEGTFSPNTVCNRAMMVSFLGNLDKVLTGIKG